MFLDIRRCILPFITLTILFLCSWTYLPLQIPKIRIWIKILCQMILTLGQSHLKSLLMRWESPWPYILVRVFFFFEYRITFWLVSSNLNNKNRETTNYSLSPFIKIVFQEMIFLNFGSTPRTFFHAFLRNFSTWSTWRLIEKITIGEFY